jgi:hypothetical protein
VDLWNKENGRSQQVVVAGLFSAAESSPGGGGSMQPCLFGPRSGWNASCAWSASVPESVASGGTEGFAGANVSAGGAVGGAVAALDVASPA